MVLAPTTILAMQHYNLISARLAPFGIRCGVLTRLQKASERKQTTEAVNCGDIRVVIGTHALLSKTLSTKQLSLLIIDEEQRFGNIYIKYGPCVQRDENLLSVPAFWPIQA